MEILRRVPYRSGVMHELAEGESEIRFLDGGKLYYIPCIVGMVNQRLSEYIHYFIVEKAIAGRKDLVPYAKAFLFWGRWLENECVDPFENNVNKLKHPTYGYLYHIRHQVKENRIASSTASNYMNVIRSFYETIHGLGVIESVAGFFQYERSIIDGYRMVQTSDLSIRIVSKQRKSLKPLNEIEQKTVSTLVSQENKSFGLKIKLMMNSGLRLDEVLTLPSGIFDEGLLAITEGNLIRGTYIGPSIKVHTKFGKERELFISRVLYEEILDYIVSDEYEYLLRRWRLKYGDDQKYEPLFITRNGQLYSSATFYSKWYKFRTSAANTLSVAEFKHKPHDLRATFATNFLVSALKHFPDMTSSALATVQYWMGHENISTAYSGQLEHPFCFI